MKEEAVTEEKLRSSTSQDYTMTEIVHSRRAGFKGHCHLGKFTLHQANTHLC